MSDEEINDTLENSDEVTQDTENQDVSTETPSDGYCTVDDVKAMFGDISDEATTDMIDVAISNATAWIESNLKRNYVPIPTEHQAALKTVARYHAASDVLLTLYHGDDLPVQYDVWFNKAQQLLEDYIDAYNNSEAPEDDLLAHQMVKHSKAQTYGQKRGRLGWVR